MCCCYPQEAHGKVLELECALKDQLQQARADLK